MKHTTWYGQSFYLSFGYVVIHKNLIQDKLRLLN